MADFRPETLIYLYKGTGVDALNQPLFTSTSNKNSWYQTHLYKSYSQYSYQRMDDRDYIMVDGKAEDLRQCDMLSFTNGALMVYARIMRVDFVNPNTVRITFEVDRMQTFIEKIEWCECWIEREMQQNDWYGDDPSFNNLQPEGIETGVMVRVLEREATQLCQFIEFSLVVLSIYDRTGEPNYGVRAEGSMPTGLNKIVFPITPNSSVSGFNNMLDIYESKGIDATAAIQGLYIVPSAYADSIFEAKQIGVPAKYPMMGGYQVLNGKCFSSEFRKLEISNQRGATVELKPENFTETVDPILQMEASFAGGSGGVILYPVGYEGCNRDFGVMLYNDVMAPFTSDGYESWYSANAGSLVYSEVTGAISGGIQGSVAGPYGAMAGAVAGLLPTFNKMLARSKDPAGLGGQAAGGAFNVAILNYGFSISWLQPTTSNIKAIDEYFSRYGYRTNRLKKPNVDTRPLWNYVKTAGALVKGPFDYEDRLEIQGNLDRGVTFWQVEKGATLGDYSNLAGNKEG